GRSYKIRRWMICPEPFGRNQFSDKVIVGPIFEELIAKPRHETATTVDEKRSFFGSDVGPSQTFREIVRIAAVLEDRGEPTVLPGVWKSGLQPPDLFERRDCSQESQVQATSNCQIRGSLCRRDVRLRPLHAECPINPGHLRLKVRVQSACRKAGSTG